MEFKLYSAHSGNLKENVIVNTMEELQALSKRFFNVEVIVDFEEKTIWIYDDYIE
jgi:hypothetical protein